MVESVGVHPIVASLDHNYLETGKRWEIEMNKWRDVTFYNDEPIALKIVVGNGLLI